MFAHHVRFSVVPAVTVAAVTACGGNSQPAARVAGSSAAPSASATPSIDPVAQRKQIWLAWTACLRQHGASEPDPGFDGSGNPQLAIRADSLPDAAKQACQPLLQNVSTGTKGGAQRPTADQMAHLIQYSQCMRQHGFPNFPDPDPQTGDLGSSSAAVHADEKDPGYLPAQQACRHLMPARG
jgi:hypothetical protein